MSLLAWAGISAVLISVLPMGGLWAVDQGSKWIQVAALTRSGFSDVTIPHSGESLDPDGDFSPVPVLFTQAFGGRWVSIYSYPYAALCGLCVELIGELGHVLPSWIAGLGILVSCLKLAKLLDVQRPQHIPWLVGFCTPVLFYSLSFWEHAANAVVAVFAILLAARACRAEAPTHLAFACFLAGLTPLIRPESVVLGPALVVGLLLSATATRRLLPAALAGWLVGLIPPLVVNQLLYGQPLGGAVQKNFGAAALDGGSAAQLGWDRLHIVVSLLYDSQSGLWSLLILLALVVAILVGRKDWWRSALVAAAALTSLASIVAEPANSLRTGLFGASPFLLMAVLAWRRASPSTAFLAGTSAAYCLLVCASSPNFGGTQWGPRYLLPVIPVIAVLAWSSCERLLHSEARGRMLAIGAIVAIVLVSLLLQGQSLRVLDSRLSRTLLLEEKLDSLGSTVLVSDVPWGVQSLARRYFDHQVLYAHRNDEIERIAERLRQHGIGEFAFVTPSERASEVALSLPEWCSCRQLPGPPGRLSILDCSLLEPPHKELAAD